MVHRMAIAWREELETGIAEIDEQHQQLVSSFNDFIYACRRGEGPKELLKLYDFLGKYVIFHFETEERIQEATNYPEYAEHKEQHQWLVDKIWDLRSELEDGKASQLTHVLDINNTLVNWLIEHIGGSDMQFGRYLKQIGYVKNSVS